MWNADCVTEIRDPITPFWRGDQACAQGIGEAPDNHELARQLAVLEERISTTQATRESAIGRPRADMAKRDAEEVLKGLRDLRGKLPAAKRLCRDAANERQVRRHECRTLSS